MKLNYVVAVVFGVIGSVIVLGAAPNVDAKDRTAAYIVGGIFLLIAVWRFFARKGH